MEITHDDNKENKEIHYSIYVGGLIFDRREHEIWNKESGYMNR